MSTSDSARLQSIKEKIRGSEHGYYRDDDISTNRYSDVLLNNHIATRKSGRATRLVCAVPGCNNDNTMIVQGRSLQFFDLPSGKDRLNRKAWLDAVPELLCTSASNRKVCRVHFVDDKPTFENPTPTLMLKSTTVKTVAKRKISEELDFSKKKREESDDDDISCTLNSCNEMNSIKLDSTSKKIPVLELRSTVDSQKNGCTLESDINTALVPTWRTPSGKLVSMKSMNNTNSTSTTQPTKFIRLANGKLARLVTKSKPSDQTMEEKEKILGTAEKSGASDGIFSMEKSSATATVTVSSKPLDLESFLGSISASTSGCASPALDIDDKSKRLSTGELDTTLPILPSISTDSGIDEKPVQTLDSLLAGLQKEEESISDTNSLEIMSSSFLPKDNIQLPNVRGRVTETSCEQCMSHLPTIRKSLGRLESRLDTMVTMVRSLIARSQTVSSTQSSCSQFEYLESSKNPAPLLNWRSSAVTECSNISSPKSLPVGRPWNSVSNIAQCTPSMNRQALQLGKDLHGKNKRKILPLPIDTSRVIRYPSVMSNADSSNQLMKTIKTGPRTKPSVALPFTKRVNSSLISNPKCDQEETNNNPATLVSSLFSTKCVGVKAPKLSVVGDSSSLKKLIIRSLLLYSGSEFTWGDYMKTAPSPVKDANKKVLESALRTLVDDGLLYQEDDDEPLTGVNTVWQKEQSKSNLRALKKYDITLNKYLANLTYIYHDDDDQDYISVVKDSIPTT